MFMAPEGLGPFFNRDAASLVLLTAGEAILYYFYFRKDRDREMTSPEEG
jgi:hypothetical protein